VSKKTNKIKYYNVMNIICFIHIFCSDKGLEVIEKQINLIKKTKLYEKLDKIYIGALGDYQRLQNSNIYKQNDKLEIVYFSKHGSEMEFPTLSKLKDFCDINTTNYKVLYIHTKGVRRPNSQFIEDWRNYMEYFLIEKHEDCLRDLDHYNTAGVNYHIKPWNHYSGNFWWANSNHIKKLIHPNKLPRTGNKYTEGGRWNAEKWLLSFVMPEYSTGFEVLLGFYGDLNGKKSDITDKLKSMVHENRLYIKRTEDINRIFGDPCPGVYKNLYLKYTVGGEIREINIPEYKTKLKRDLLLDGNFIIKIKCYHESGLHHYHHPYPRHKYLIK